MTDIDTDAIRAKHRRCEVTTFGDEKPRHSCGWCGLGWPCDAVRLANALDEARVRLGYCEALHTGINTYEDMRARAERAEKLWRDRVEYSNAMEARAERAEAAIARVRAIVADLPWQPYRDIRAALDGDVPTQ